MPKDGTTHAHRLSEVGAKATTDLMEYCERQWADFADFKDALIELLDASNFDTPRVEKM